MLGVNPRPPMQRTVGSKRTGCPTWQYKRTSRTSRLCLAVSASQDDRRKHGQELSASTKRVLLVAGLLGVPSLTLVSAPKPAEAVRRTLQQDPRLKPLQQYWSFLVAQLQQQLSDSFAPTLVFYGAAEMLPSGTPGDPALEYSRATRAACGPFTSAFSQPYSVCPAEPAGVPGSDLARDCCRHFAYCVPRSRYALSALDRQSSVVASPRLALAHADTWKGVLVHEMGHCIDFHVFPGRYLLPDEPTPQSSTAIELLAAIDTSENDVELRADMMANALLGPALGGKKLCYNKATHIQMLVPDSTVCADVDSLQLEGSGGSSNSGFMEHFPHPPVSVRGSVVRGEAIQ